MANSWLRLWHDMPNDPKWRSIARASKQSIPSVMAVYLHLLVNASNATERGRTQNVCNEDIANALDLETEQVDEIISAMQGRVLDEDQISGWSKRQVEREDGAAERARAWREAKKNKEKETQPNANERKRTPDKDTDKDTDKSKPNTKAKELLATLEISKNVAEDFISLRNRLKAPITQTSLNGIQREAVKAGLTLEAALQICCERSWRGFKAEWLNSKKNNSFSGVQEAQLDVARQIWGNQNGNDRSFIDIDANGSITGDGKNISKALPEIRESVAFEVEGD